MDVSGQDGIYSRVIGVCLQNVQRYEPLFEGGAFDAGQLETLYRCGGGAKYI